MLHKRIVNRDELSCCTVEVLMCLHLGYNWSALLVFFYWKRTFTTTWQCKYVCKLQRWNERIGPDCILMHCLVLNFSNSMPGLFNSSIQVRHTDCMIVCMHGTTSYIIHACHEKCNMVQKQKLLLVYNILSANKMAKGFCPWPLT